MKHFILIVLFLSVNCAICRSQVDSVYYGMPYEKLVEFLGGFVNEGINSSGIVSAEDADEYSEGLLYAAADISYDECNFIENLNSLAYAFLSLSIKEKYFLVNDMNLSIEDNLKVNYKEYNKLSSKTL